jgi:Pyridoxamine 5'-phosphate oxidase
MELDQALEAARATHQFVLTTIRKDGKPQLSNVLHTVEDDGVIPVSTTADRAKYLNLRREPWAALKVDDESFSEVEADPQDAARSRLPARDGRRAARGGRLTPTLAYGALALTAQLPPTARAMFEKRHWPR